MSHIAPSGVPWSQQVDKAEAGPPRVTWFNTYHFVRLVDLEKANPTENQDNRGDMADTPPTWPPEHDMDMDEEPSDGPQGEHMARHDWRADLTEDTYGYHIMVQPPEPGGR